MKLHALQTLIAERIAAGLHRKSMTSCSKWACTYRMMGQPFPGKWRFKYHPWLKGMHDSEAMLNVGQKAAQMGYTETVLNVSFYNIDVKGVDCLYVLPAKTPDASDFSASRFDPALELSPHLSRIFSDVKNIGHKRAGSTNLYIRGSKSRSGLKSVPVGLLVLDELDEMAQENIPLALERTSGQMEKNIWMISTATIDNYGISRYFNESSQNHFFFKCPSCSRMTELVFPDSIVITGESIEDSEKLKNSHLICKECKNTIHHETKHEWLAKSEWVEGFSNPDSAGWHINQMYSSTIKPYDFALSYIKSLTNKADEQEFWNSKCGLPHAVEGSRVTDDQINECRGDYLRNNSIAQSPVITMGVDVGGWLHYYIDEWFLPQFPTPGIDLNTQSKCRTLTYGKVRDFEQLDNLMMNWGITFCVIDAQPERRKSIEFANRFYGRVRVCWYPNGIAGKTLHLNDEEQSVSVDRTSWLDISLGRFRRGKPWFSIPQDIDQEYRTHMKALVRVYEKDQNDNPVGRYVKGADDDHYAHARNYSEIALPLAASLATPHDIRRF